MEKIICKKLFGYDADKLPRFALFILTEKNIPDKNKKKFIDKFLIKYLNDEEYRNTVDGWYLFFRKHKYKGVDQNTEEIDETVEPGEIAIWYKIGKHDIFSYNKFNTFELKVDNLKYGPFLIECNMYINNKKLFDEVSISEVTSLFPSKIFSYDNNKFFERLPGKFYGYNYKKELEYLKKILKPTKSHQKLLLEFKEPIYIGLDELEPVPVYYFIVSKEDELPILIGLDVICQYDISLTALNGNPIMVVKERALQEKNYISKINRYFYNQQII